LANNVEVEKPSLERSYVRGSDRFFERTLTMPGILDKGSKGMFFREKKLCI